MILDEPLARIDLKSELLIVDILSDLAENGKTIIAFEHRLDYLLVKANKVILLADNTVHLEGSPKEIVSNLMEIDIPEVALLEIDGNNKYPLSIEEAERLVREVLQ